MNLKNFHQELMSMARVAAEVNRDFVRSAFVEEAGSRLSEAEEISDFQICHYEGLGARKRRLQVDGYSMDDADGSMSLVVAEFSNDESIKVFGAAEARRCFAALKAFVDEALVGNLTNGTIDEAQPGFGLAVELKRLLSTIVRFRFYLVSDGRLNTRVQDWPEEDVQGVPVEFHIWDLERFHRAHESASGRDSLEVDFCESGFDGLPCLAAGVPDGGYEAYLCMIPGALLAGIYEHHGSRLLEGNVRSFLTTKGKVNSGMQETILNCPEMFFAYNNGIAATAEAIVKDESGRRLIRATNLQIVNGGQTTASLATAKRNGEDLSRVRVQMKLSVLAPERAGEMIPLIARYANSQNKVNDADFFANHAYHVRLEEISRSLQTPPASGAQYGTHWFYERARGQFLNQQAGLTKSHRDQFLLKNPKTQLLTKTDVAKLENTWRGYPHKVSYGAQKNFLFFAEWVAKAWTDDDQQFDKQYFRHLAVLAILFRHTEGLVSRQSWYQGGYRANVVTYSLAKLHFMILRGAKGRELDLRPIWEQQVVPHDLSEQIRVIAESVFGVLTRPGRPKENVTEWAKMERCWAEVQELNILLNAELLIVQHDPKLQRAFEDQAVGVQPVGFGLFARTAVMSVEGSAWETMRRWGTSTGYLNTRESDLLRAASRLPKFAPTAKDCEKILKIRAKLVSKGYEVS
jgi:hypothetical protein